MPPDQWWDQAAPRMDLSGQPPKSGQRFTQWKTILTCLYIKALRWKLPYGLGMMSAWRKTIDATKKWRKPVLFCRFPLLSGRFTRYTDKTFCDNFAFIKHLMTGEPL